MYAATTSQYEEVGQNLTKHALKRIESRRLTLLAVTAALDYGRVVHVRGAEIHAIGRKEVEQCSRWGLDLSAHEGVQVICTAEGAVMTVYRNRDFRGLKPRRRHSRFPR